MYIYIYIYIYVIITRTPTRPQGGLPLQHWMGLGTGFRAWGFRVSGFRAVSFRCVKGLVVGSGLRSPGFTL